MPRGSNKFGTMDMSDGLFTKGLDVKEVVQPEVSDIEVKELSDDISVNEYLEDVENKGWKKTAAIVGGSAIAGAGAAALGLRHLSKEHERQMKEDPQYRREHRAWEREKRANNDAYKNIPPIRMGNKKGEFRSWKDVEKFQDQHDEKYRKKYGLKELSDGIEVKGSIGNASKYIAEKLVVGALWGTGAYAANQALEEAKKKVKPNIYLQRRETCKINNEELKELSDEIETKGAPREFAKYIGDKLATAAIGAGSFIGASKIANIKKGDQPPPPVKVRVTVENKKRNTEIKRSKGFEDIEVKELSDEIEVKSLGEAINSIRTAKAIYRTARNSGMSRTQSLKRIGEIANSSDHDAIRLMAEMQHKPSSNKPTWKSDIAKVGGGALVGGIAGYGLGKKKEYVDIEQKSIGEIAARPAIGVYRKYNAYFGSEAKEVPDDIEVKSMYGDIETKSIFSEGMNFGRRAIGWARGGNRFKRGVTAVAKKKPVNENPLFRQFSIDKKHGVQVQHQTGRMSKTPLEQQKIAANRSSGRRWVAGGLGATALGATAYGVGKKRGEFQTRERLKNRPYWMDNQEQE